VGDRLEDIKIIFGSKLKPIKPVIYEQRSPRKTRSDKKHDIKFRLSAADKRILKTKAMNLNVSLTTFLSNIVSDHLSNSKTFILCKQEKEGSFVHAVLPGVRFKDIQNFSIEYDSSFRNVAHSIIQTYLQKESNVKIIHYNDKGECL
jgi:hypothetical protein